MEEKLKPIPPPKCQYCGKSLPIVWFTSWSNLEWEGDEYIGHYVESKDGDAEEKCPHCEAKWPLEPVAYDYQKQRRKRRIKPKS